MTSLDIAGISVAPGTRRRHSVELTELADGTKVSIPLDLINGAEPGPRLYLGAAIHGDEVDGVGILFRALAGVDPKRLRGSIVCVPVQHPLSFHADHRLPISQFMKSPLDQAPADAWTCFPGVKNGNLAQELAATLFEMVKTCDWAIDIHTPTRGGRYVPIAILPHPSLGESHKRAEEMAHAFGSGWIMRTDTGFYVADGILCVEATRAGVPAFTFETGEGGRLEEEIIDGGALYVRNVMKWLRMIDGEPLPAAKTYVMKEFLGLRATRGGLLLTRAALGDIVNEGDLLCSIVNIYGDEVETITAPARRGVRALDHALDRIARRARGDPRPALSPGVREVASRGTHRVAFRARSSICAGRWCGSTAPTRRAIPPPLSKRSRPCSTPRPESSIAAWSAGRRRSISSRGHEGRAPAAGSCSTATSTPFRSARPGGRTLRWGRTWRTGASTGAAPAT